jgi:hypothetical protein
MGDQLEPFPRGPLIPSRARRTIERRLRSATIILPPAVSMDTDASQLSEPGAREAVITPVEPAEQLSR